MLLGGIQFVVLHEQMLLTLVLELTDLRLTPKYMYNLEKNIKNTQEQDLLVES